MNLNMLYTFSVWTLLNILINSDYVKVFPSIPTANDKRWVFTKTNFPPFLSKSLYFRIMRLKFREANESDPTFCTKKVLPSQDSLSSYKDDGLSISPLQTTYLRKFLPIYVNSSSYKKLILRIFHLVMKTFSLLVHIEDKK